MFPVRLKHIVSAAALLALAGCSGQGVSATPPSQPASHGAAQVPEQFVNLDGDTITIKHVGVRITGENPTMNMKYGRILGYFNGKTSINSQIVKVTAATTIVFNSVDTLVPHTASFLGDATSQMAPWPARFDGSSTQSPAGTVISTANFGTGVLSPGQKSLKYNSGSPGFYMFGCYFHYNTDGMRTVIIVQ
jgi:plastocyanin